MKYIFIIFIKSKHKLLLESMVFVRESSYLGYKKQYQSKENKLKPKRML